MNVPSTVPPAPDVTSTPLRVEFTCTYDDFSEAHKIHRRPARRDRIGMGERLLFLWILLATLGAVITIGVVEAIYRGIRAGGAPTVTLTVTEWVIAVAVPWMMWLLVAELLWYALCGVAGAAERKPARQMLLLLMTVSLFNLILTTYVAGGPEAQRAREAAAPESDVPFIVTLLPWLAILAVMWFYIFRYLRGMLPRHWDAQPQLRLPQVLEQTDRGLRFTDPLGTHNYKWAAFRKFREGDGLFLLYTSDVAFHMVPKRAMTEPGEVESFRQLVEQRVATDGPIPARFPLHQPEPAPTASGTFPPARA